MRALLAVTLLSLSGTVAQAAAPSKLAVFDFEMIDTSLQGEVYGKRSDEQERLKRTGDQVRRELGESGKFQILDIAPVNAAAHQSNLQSCGGCDSKLARQLGRRGPRVGAQQGKQRLFRFSDHFDETFRHIA